MKPEISIIIPIYNAEKYLQENLDSLLNQTFGSFEIICVDDGSTDRTMSILEDYADKDSRIIILSQKNQRAGIARNNGMKKARGKYLLFLDADDFFEPQMLELIHAKAVSVDADVVLFDGRQYDNAADKYIYPSHYLKRDMILEKDPFNRMDFDGDLFQITSPCPWTKLFKREFIEQEQLQFQNLPNTNDAYFVLSAVGAAGRITTLKERLVNYRINNESSTQSNKKKNPLCFLEAFNAIYHNLIEKGIYADLEKGFIGSFLSCCVFSLNSFRDNQLKRIIIEAIKKSEIYNSGIMNHEESYYYKYNDYVLVESSVRSLAWHDAHIAPKNKNIRVIKHSSCQDTKISVIVPVYNTEKYLAECLDSIIGQTLKDIQIICVDDGSVDNSSSILNQYAAQDERICIVRQENSGLSAARNTGIQYAEGEYIYYIDSDDYLEINALEVLYNRMFSDNLDLLFFDGISFYDDAGEEKKKMEEYYVRKHDYHQVYKGVDLLYEMEHNNEYRVSACMQMIRTQFLRDKGLSFVEGILHEDNLYTFQAILKASRASHISDKLYLRRVHGNSITTQKEKFNHCYGYFVTYLRMQKELDLAAISDLDKLGCIADIPYRIFSNSVRIYNTMDPMERYYFYGLNPEEYYIFMAIIFNPHNREKDNYCRLKQTYAEKSEINAKLQITYREKAERGIRIKELEKENEKLRNAYLLNKVKRKLKKIIQGK